MNEFAIGKESFLLNGKPFRIISGAVHYFRVPREYWRDRLLKLKACGFNTVETYTAWNMHEPREGEFDFSDMLDLNAYLKLAQELGLYAIVRPGPYICSEWDFGALPWWLLAKEEMELRCMNQPYLSAVDKYFDKLIPIIAENQISNGGCVILTQVENEYGSYGDDSEYIRYLAAGMKKRGITVPFFTSDGAADYMLSGGTVAEIHKTCNFGSNPAFNFSRLREYQPDGPLICAEYWNGWFDHWGEKHHSRNPRDAASTLDEILSMGASVSVYMFHGGSNFGYMNGANADKGVYQPTVSSYDDDAPVSECGDLTEKYFEMKKVVSKYNDIPEIPVCDSEKAAYGAYEFDESADAIEVIKKTCKPVSLTNPVCMEKLGQGYGFVLYSSSVRGKKENMPLNIEGIHDRAYVYTDGKFAGIQYRNDNKPKISFGVPKEGVELDIFVENMGRVNYGVELADKKGILGSVCLGQNHMYHWKAYSFENPDFSKIEFKSGKCKTSKRPQLLRKEIYIDNPADTFIKLEGFKKGMIYFNGKPLGRYWNIDPQKTTYLPAPFIRKGKNELVVLDLEGFKKPLAEFTDRPEL